jgi:hypothetical protein
MKDYILFMHNDAPDKRYNREEEWIAYIANLERAGVFQGGSAIGDGLTVSKSPAVRGVTQHIAGYIRIQAESLEHVRELIVGNPVFEAGGTVEIRELPKT